MKKSEALEKLAEYLNDEQGMSAECCEYHAEKLLEFIEKDLGMKPPFLETINDYHYCGDDAFHTSNDVYEWELERK